MAWTETTQLVLVQTLRFVAAVIAANGSFPPSNCSDFILTDQQAFSTERGQTNAT